MSRFVRLIMILLVGGLTMAEPLPGTAPLEDTGDLAAEMVAGIDRYLSHALSAAADSRAKRWSRDVSSPGAYAASVEVNRQRLRRIVGAVDARLPARMELVATAETSAQLALTAKYQVLEARWPVFPGVYGEGLLLEPIGPAQANVVALPDCGWTPEALAGLTDDLPAPAQFARRLAEAGCRVVVPALVSREPALLGNPAVRAVEYPYREYIHRMAYEMGRTLTGYESQKISAVVDWFAAKGDEPIGVAGYGEGALLALYTAALDTRLGAALVSGYFQPRERLWAEPIYRNVWSLLTEFGDAEIASLIAPRMLVVEPAKHPEVQGPAPESEYPRFGAPGVITTPPIEDVEREYRRARELAGQDALGEWIQFAPCSDGLPGGAPALDRFLAALGIESGAGELAPPKPVRVPDAQARMRRQVKELAEFTQHLMRESFFTREKFWSKADATSAETWVASAQWYRDYFWDEVIGRLPVSATPGNPRTRLVYDEPGYRGYEVKLDVYPDVFAYGILLVPKNIAEGERRPAVVCQHGLEGRPQDVADPAKDDPFYHRFGCQLADQGFVVFAPQNPYIGGDKFRVLQRKANPLKLSLFSFIVRQHERILDWLAAQPFVDPERIGFYGLSYGGKTAMRAPALLDRYCLSICSGDFNEWIWKNVSNRYPFSYTFTGEYEMAEFDLGNTFNYSEMSWLIFPRPFMVERGHHDGVGIDEWVAYEYARTRRHYNVLGLGDRTEIEYFDGPHTIHGVGTFAFLKKHLSFAGKTP